MPTGELTPQTPSENYKQAFFATESTQGITPDVIQSVTQYLKHQ